MASPTKTPQRLQGMVAVGKGSKVKLLGFITWFSIPQDPVKISALRKAWVLAGLDPTPLPRDQRAADVFKRAMRGQEGRITNPDRTITQTDVVDVVNSEEEIVYQISRVVRDADNKVVDYPKALRAVFSKAHETIAFKPLGGVSRDDVLPMMNGVQDYYDQNAKTVTGNKVRGIVRNFIQADSDEQSHRVGLSGENMRGQAGGVYFVLERYSEELDGLAQALDELYPASRAYLYSVPLADGATERELIRRHHVASSLDDAKKAIADVAKLLRSDRLVDVRGDVRAHHWGKLHGMKRRVAMYGQALKDDEAEVQDVMTMLERQLNKLP
jgi:hypothetical protein